MNKDQWWFIRTALDIMDEYNASSRKDYTYSFSKSVDELADIYHRDRDNIAKLLENGYE